MQLTSRYVIAAGAIAIVAALGPSQAHAGPILTEGSVLSNYAVVSVGPKASVTVNSGPINGNVLIGDGAGSTSSGGGNGQVTGVVDHTSDASGDFLAHLQIPPTIVTVANSIGTQAFTDANTLATTAAGLAPTQTFGSINGAQTIAGDGGLNVIDVASLQNPDLTFTGTAADEFVLNVSGLFQTNQAIILNGVTASQILWNFTGASGTVFQTSGGDVLYGTFLAAFGGDFQVLDDTGNFQFSGLNLTGQLINTEGHMQIVSNSKIPTFAPFTPPPQSVPEPGSLILLGTGLIGLGALRRAKKARVGMPAG